MKHERPPGRHPRNLRGRRARPLVAVRGKTSYIQCRAQRVLASEDDHLEGAPRRAARPCRPRRERRLSPLHGTAAAPHNAAVPLLEATTAPAVWRSDRCGRMRAANTARSAQSRPGRGSVRRRTATSSTLCPQQGLLHDHAEGPCSIPQTDGRRCRRPRGRRRVAAGRLNPHRFCMHARDTEAREPRRDRRPMRLCVFPEDEGVLFGRTVERAFHSRAGRRAGARLGAVWVR